MSDKPFLPKSQDVTWKELLIALVVVVYGITAIIILESYSRFLGALMIGVPVVIAKVWMLYWERDHKQEMAQGKKEVNESGLGKTFNYGSIFVIAGLVLYFSYRFIVN